MIFDNPGRLQNTPKYFEQRRRDSLSALDATYVCMDMTTDSPITPKKWRQNILGCRVCKRNLVLFLGQYFLHNSSTFLRANQVLYIAGAFAGEISDTAWYITGGRGQPEPDPKYACNAEEADTRLWLHVKNTDHHRVLVITPDTDVYMIGLGLQGSGQTKDVIAQVSPYSSRELTFLHMSRLIRALETDPDLGKLKQSELPFIFQALFVCTGCDYVSFFSGIGKSTFLRYFFQYSSFITGGTHPSTPGTLGASKVPITNWKLGYLAFIRLIGTVYFKKYSSGFIAKCPATHFSTFANMGLSVEQQHHRWMDDIRETIWFRTQFENEIMPSNESLQLHWKRSCWVLNLWEQAEEHDMQPQPISDHGWSVKNGSLTVQWDTLENLQLIRDRLHSLTKGCKCATGCTTNRCGCKKNGTTCSAGCECTNCNNISQNKSLCVEGTGSAIRDLSIEEERQESDYIDADDMADYIFESSEVDNIESLPTEVDAIMDFVFDTNEIDNSIDSLDS